MVGKAASIAECSDLESLWDMGKEMPTTRQIQLSHSDIGPYIHFVCPEEHHVVGPAMVTCLKGGVWDDITEPYCSSSSLYGIPQSDTVLIGVLAGSGAIVLITLTVILTHLFCLRTSTIRKATSSDGLHRSDESLPSTTYYVDDQSFCSISAPTCPTINGRPLQTVSRGHVFNGNGTTPVYDHHLQRYHHVDSTSDHLVSRADYFGRQEDNSAHALHVNGHVTSIGDENVFVNNGFNTEQSSMYSNHWELPHGSSKNSNSFQMTTLNPNADGNTRHNSAHGYNYEGDTATPTFDVYSTVNRTVL